MWERSGADWMQGDGQSPCLRLHGTLARERAALERMPRRTTNPHGAARRDPSHPPPLLPITPEALPSSMLADWLRRAAACPASKLPDDPSGSAARRALVCHLHVAAAIMLRRDPAPGMDADPRSGGPCPGPWAAARQFVQGVAAALEERGPQELDD